MPGADLAEEQVQAAAMLSNRAAKMRTHQVTLPHAYYQHEQCQLTLWMLQLPFNLPDLLWCWSAKGAFELRLMSASPGHQHEAVEQPPISASSSSIGLAESSDCCDGNSEVNVRWVSPMRVLKTFSLIALPCLAQQGS